MFFENFNLSKISRYMMDMLNSPVYDASQHYHIWAHYFPNNVDRSVPRDFGQRSLYIYFANNH